MVFLAALVATKSSIASPTLRREYCIARLTDHLAARTLSIISGGAHGCARATPNLTTILAHRFMGCVYPA